MAYAGQPFLIPLFPQAFVDRARKQPEYENDGDTSYEDAHNSALYLIVLALTLKLGNRQRFLARKPRQDRSTLAMTRPSPDSDFAKLDTLGYHRIHSKYHNPGTQRASEFPRKVRMQRILNSMTIVPGAGLMGPPWPESRAATSSEGSSRL